MATGTYRRDLDHQSVDVEAVSETLDGERRGHAQVDDDVEFGRGVLRVWLDLASRLEPS